MLGNNQSVTNEKPQVKAATSTQGNTITAQKGSDNSTTLRESKSRHDKGMELYKAGKVSIGPNGLFKVSGYYECDTERMTCTCPDYKTRKEPCKHIFAACLFVKNRGKEKIEALNGPGNGNLQPEAKEPAPKPQEARGKDFSRQSTITRLAVINSAIIEVLKTHRKPIEVAEVLSFASQLETWALGK